MCENQILLYEHCVCYETHLFNVSRQYSYWQVYETFMLMGSITRNSARFLVRCVRLSDV